MCIAYNYINTKYVKIYIASQHILLLTYQSIYIHSDLNYLSIQITELLKNEYAHFH